MPSFAGSRRLMEVADSILEIKTICDCGAKATVNARIDGGGPHCYPGPAAAAGGGNDSYIAMCHKCWIRGIRERRKISCMATANPLICKFLEARLF